jgi:2,4-dienoyl-CoA reductase-like NADH-dependent reductase (Old Yellow Enzyme family)
MYHESFFQPYLLKSLSLRNRFVMAPMTRSFSPGGIPTQEVAEYYRRRAEGKVGLILSEGTVIDRPSSSNHPDIPRFHGSDALQGWKNVINAVSQAGGAMAPQLWHMGIVSKKPSSPDFPPAPLEGPSGLNLSGEPEGNTMSEEEIQKAIQGYASAARSAKELGFQAIELHGAHGYLIDQFFWEKTNLRDDRYGGKTLVERSRFAVETVRAVRQAVGEDFPIILRLSQWKSGHFENKLARTPNEMEAWLTPLAEAGVDVFHCSQRRFWEPEFSESDLNFAGWAKKLTGKPTITVGSVGLSGEFTRAFAGESSRPTPIDDLARRLEKGEFDLVAVGRSLLSDPEWVKKTENGETEEWKGFDPADLKRLF